jgi:flagellar basal body-associated protein FliL
MKLSRTLLLLLLSFCLSLSSVAWAEDEEKTGPAPGYLALNSIVVNLSKGARHARFEVQLMVNDKEQLGDVRTHRAAVVNELLMTISDEDGAVLKTPKGKEAFRQKALDACNKTLKELTGIDKPLRDLFFTTFFVR